MKNIQRSLAWVLMIFMILPLAVSAQDYKKIELYTQGNKAYKNDNYVVGLKLLYAFKVLNEGQLKENNDFATSLDKAIQDCEDNLNTKIAQKPVNNPGTHVGSAGLGKIGLKGAAMEKPDNLKDK